MRRLLVLLAIAGCGGSRAPERSPAPVAPPAPVVAKRPHTVQPHELILYGVPREGVRRAVIKRIGEARLRRDGESVTTHGWASDWPAPVAVAELTDDEVRIVHEDDDARLLLWIDRADLSKVVSREVTLGTDGTLAPGTPLATWNVDGTIHVEVEGLLLDGVIDPYAIDVVWEAPPGEPADGGGSITGVIRAEPSRNARVVATTTASISVIERGSRDGWTEVETIGPLVRVHGFVEDKQVSFGTFGTGSGHGYGVSHKIDVEMAAGACLYDAIEGEMIGVNLVARTRYAERGDVPGWFLVMVNSPWALLRIPAHDAGDGFDVCVTIP